ncbi:hypothetical protein CYMTET_7179 [Cymbomonas tetramitiformis]|uniref:Calmodulin n=1 Tax=Cymbomonas tetramitiformis TaxID=36881 RepID=A0AAE0GW09_9CHLO|nr:hypothetical protein CYMTET_7179 [Cymbomonas tetramitiformis]
MDRAALLGKLSSKATSVTTKFWSHHGAVAAIYKPPAARTRTDVVNILEAIQALPIFNGLDASISRNLCYIMLLQSVRKGSSLYFGEPLSAPTGKEEQRKGTTPEFPHRCYTLVLGGKAKFLRTDVEKAVKHELTEEERDAEILRMFQEIDEDGSGEVEPDEIVQSLKKQGVSITEQEVKKMITIFDPNGDGSIDLEEFSGVMKSNPEAKDWFSQLKEQKAMQDVFKEIDVDGSGEIDVDELITAMKAFGLDLPDEQVQEMFNEADIDGGGSIGFEEFVGILKSTSADDSDSLERNLTSGDMIGDGAFTEGTPLEQGALTATERCDLLMLDRSEFERVCKEGFDGQLEQKKALLAQLPHFAGCTEDNLRNLALCSLKTERPRGARICVQGEPSEEMYLIMEGECCITHEVNIEASEEAVDNGGAMPSLGPGQIRRKARSRRPKTMKVSILLSRLMPGEICGELPALEEVLNQDTVVTAAPCSLICMHRLDLQKFMPQADYHNMRSQAGTREKWRQRKRADTTEVVKKRVALGGDLLLGQGVVDAQVPPTPPGMPSGFHVPEEPMGGLPPKPPKLELARIAQKERFSKLTAVPSATLYYHNGEVMKSAVQAMEQRETTTPRKRILAREQMAKLADENLVSSMNWAQHISPPMSPSHGSPKEPLSPSTTARSDHAKQPPTEQLSVESLPQPKHNMLLSDIAMLRDFRHRSLTGHASGATSPNPYFRRFIVKNSLKRVPQNHPDKGGYRRGKVASARSSPNLPTLEPLQIPIAQSSHFPASLPRTKTGEVLRPRNGLPSVTAAVLQANDAALVPEIEEKVSQESIDPFVNTIPVAPWGNQETITSRSSPRGESPRDGGGFFLTSDAAPVSGNLSMAEPEIV